MKIPTGLYPFEARLTEAFYRGEDVVRIARDLLGKYLVTQFPEGRTVGRIVETEAYRGPDDRACHAWNNRCTPRTKVMFEAGGRAYVYLCYGMHHLFNVVTGPEGMPHAVLIRALEPVENLELMMSRRRLSQSGYRLTSGPGSLSCAMGIRTAHTGVSLLDMESPIWLEDRGAIVPEDNIQSGPRIGVHYAGECAQRPWRFLLKDNPWVSRG